MLWLSFAEERTDAMAVKPWSFMKNAGSMEVERFANELSDILCRYFGDKFNLSQHGITLDRVIRELETKQISAARLGELKYIWEEINFIQFAPAKAGKEKITELYDKIINILEQLEKNGVVQLVSGSHNIKIYKPAAA